MNVKGVMVVVDCMVCNGTGKVPDPDDYYHRQYGSKVVCPTCRGTKTVSRKMDLTDFLALIHSGDNDKSI